jgi:hypothetical protein
MTRAEFAQEIGEYLLNDKVWCSRCRRWAYTSHVEGFGDRCDACGHGWHFATMAEDLQRRAAAMEEETHG